MAWSSSTTGAHGRPELRLAIPAQLGGGSARLGLVVRPTITRRTGTGRISRYIEPSAFASPCDRTAHRPALRSAKVGTWIRQGRATISGLAYPAESFAAFRMRPACPPGV